LYLRTYAYIDGFNFYYRCLKVTPYKWLDLKELSRRQLQPEHEIEAIKYFTALVSALDDPQRPVKQKTYIRALETYIADLTVYAGSFQTLQIMARLVKPINGKKYAEIRKIVSNVAIALTTQADNSLFYAHSLIDDSTSTCDFPVESGLTR
jgi:hypothetical protein